MRMITPLVPDAADAARHLLPRLRHMLLVSYDRDMVSAHHIAP
jgi:hypothetical protein